MFAAPTLVFVIEYRQCYALEKKEGMIRERIIWTNADLYL